MDYSKLFDKARDSYAMLSYNNKSGKALIPLRYFFELTYLCNLNCPYCYVGKDRKKDELTTQEWFNIIEQIPFYSFVTLVGGEPLLRKDFIPILEKTAKKTFGKLNVVTNGVLINDEIIDAFIRTKMMLLSVSLDGYGETHDKNRGVNSDNGGIFDKVVSNLETLKSKSRKPMIDIKTIILENNIDDLLKLYKLCEKMNFEFLSISFLRNNDLKQNSVLKETFSQEFYAQKYPIKPYFDMEHFKEIYKEILAINGKTKIRFSPKFESKRGGKYSLDKIDTFFNYGENQPIQEIYEPCKFPFSNIFINPQGDVYPCLSLKTGNAKEKQLKEIFNSPKYCCFRKNLKTSKVFESCQMCCELSVK